MKLSLIICLFAAMTFAKAPRDFKRSGKQFRFVDFDQVNYDITYDVKNESVQAITTISFNQKTDGHPIFDLIPAIESIEIDGVQTSALEISSPSKETTYRSIEETVKRGSHTLVIKSKVSKNIDFESGSVSSAFWMSDLNDRQYIEQYLPTNVEYDQYAVTMNIKIEGSSKELRVYTNGEVNRNSKNNFSIVYPDYFTASSLYFHMAPKGKFDEVEFKYKSTSGRSFQVTIYKKESFWGTSLKSLKAQTIKILGELESKFGNWPHPSLTIYNAGMGGMEYSGATITSTRALGHELIHSYFARGVLPVDGNSGWMDEAIASWRDGGYKAVTAPNFTRTSMAAHSPYRRYTDRNAYTKGANFMAYLNNKLKPAGGLTKFLNELHTNYSHKNITTRDFIKEVNSFSGLRFNADFDKYIFSKSSLTKRKEVIPNNPYHPVLTEKQLKELL